MLGCDDDHLRLLLTLLVPLLLLIPVFIAVGKAKPRISRSRIWFPRIR